MPNPSQIPKSHSAAALPSLSKFPNRRIAQSLLSLPSPSNRTAAALPSLSVESHSRCPPFPLHRIAQRRCPPFPLRRIAQRRCPPSHPLTVWRSGRLSSSAVCVSSIVCVSDSPPCSGQRLRLSSLFRFSALHLTEDRALVFVPSPTLPFSPHSFPNLPTAQLSPNLPIFFPMAAPQWSPLSSPAPPFWPSLPIFFPTVAHQ